MFSVLFKPFHYRDSVLESVVDMIAETDLSVTQSEEQQAIELFLSLMALKGDNATALSADYRAIQSRLLSLKTKDSEKINMLQSVVAHPVLAFVQIGLAHCIEKREEDNQIKTLIFKLNEVQSNWASVDTFLNNIIFLGVNQHGISKSIYDIKRAELDIHLIAEHSVNIQNATANVARDLLIDGKLKAAELVLRSYEKFYHAICAIFDKAELNKEILNTYALAEKAKPKRDKRYRNQASLVQKSQAETVANSQDESINGDTKHLPFSYDDMKAKGWLNLDDYNEYNADLTVDTNNNKPNKKEHKDVVAQFKRVQEKINDLCLFTGERLTQSLRVLEDDLSLTLSTKSYCDGMIGEINGILSYFMSSIQHISKDESVYSIVREICQLKRVISKVIYSKQQNIQAQSKVIEIVQS